MAKNPKKVAQNPIIARAREHVTEMGTRIVRVPEWPDENGDATEIHVHPFTIKDQQRLYAKSRGDTENPEILVETILLKACDDQGEQLFTLDDKRDLMNAVDGNVIARIAHEIMGLIPSEDLEKN